MDIQGVGSVPVSDSASALFSLGVVIEDILGLIHGFAEDCESYRKHRNATNGFSGTVCQQCRTILGAGIYCPRCYQNQMYPSYVMLPFFSLWSDEWREDMLNAIKASDDIRSKRQADPDYGIGITVTQWI